MLREQGHLKPYQLVCSVKIVVDNKPLPVIKIGHQNGRQYFGKGSKKSKSDSSITPASDRSLGLRRLRLIPGLKMPIVNALKKEGITTVAAIRKILLADMLLNKNISGSRARGIKEALTDIKVVVD